MSLATIYRIPASIAVASLVGLVSALVGDGPWDALSWLTLGGAAAIGTWYALRPPSRQEHRGPDAAPDTDSPHSRQLK